MFRGSLSLGASGQLFVWTHARNWKWARPTPGLATGVHPSNRRRSRYRLWIHLSSDSRGISCYAPAWWQGKSHGIGCEVPLAFRAPAAHHSLPSELLTFWSQATPGRQSAQSTTKRKQVEITSPLPIAPRQGVAGHMLKKQVRAAREEEGYLWRLPSCPVFVAHNQPNHVKRNMHTVSISEARCKNV